MGTTTGWALVALGCVLTFGGAVMAFDNLGALQPVLLWGLSSVVGFFVLVFGVTRLQTAHAGAGGERGEAPGKTDI